MQHKPIFKWFSLSAIWLWLGLFALLPFCLTLIASFLGRDEAHLVLPYFTVQYYLQLFNPTYLNIFAQSFYLAGLCTLLCLLFGYPFAYLLAHLKPRYKGLLILMVIIPFWTSSLIRSYSMITILKSKGILNSFLLWLGVIDKPLPILYSNTAVLIGLVYNLLPFMVLPLLTNIERLDQRLIDAAHDLGAGWTRTFIKIILPLTMPGIISGCILVLLPAMTIFYIPDILGGSKSLLLGNLIQNQFLLAQNWPFGSAISMALTLLLAILLLVYWRNSESKTRRDIL